MDKLYLSENQVEQESLKLRSASRISHAQGSASRDVHLTETGPNSKPTERMASNPVRQEKLFPQRHRTRQNLLTLLHQMRDYVHVL